jgi:predicted GNAT superfamily acetyltransferase
VRVRHPGGTDDLRAVARVLTAIWGETTDGPPLRPEVVTALHHSGAYVAVAEHGDDVVGASVGWIGIAGTDRGEPVLHSHITGVADGHRDAGVGFALKQDQRTWCRDRGLHRITWTFDPLLRRNAFFNLHRLAAVVATYHTDFYGRMDDELNRGESTDRAVAEWHLDAPRVADAAVRRTTATPSTEHMARGAVAVLVVDADGGPAEAGAAILGRTALVATPADAMDLRRRDRRLADRWRAAQREHLATLLGTGWQLVDFTSDGSYVARHADDAEDDRR